MAEAAPALERLWHSRRLSSAEHFSYLPAQGASALSGTLSGTVVLPLEGRPTTIRYTVVVDNVWQLQTARVAVVDHRGESRIDVRVADGEWWVGGQRRTDLAGCSDIDLGWTPSTNTLPIRRTSLIVGESTTLRAAWLSLPGPTIRPVDQRYDRIDDVTWGYRSGDFAAEVVTDRFGFVERYGDDIWFAIA